MSFDDIFMFSIHICTLWIEGKASVATHVLDIGEINDTANEVQIQLDHQFDQQLKDKQEREFFDAEQIQSLDQVADAVHEPVEEEQFHTPRTSTHFLLYNPSSRSELPTTPRVNCKNLIRSFLFRIMWICVQTRFNPVADVRHAVYEGGQKEFGVVENAPQYKDLEKTEFTKRYTSFQDRQEPVGGRKVHYRSAAPRAPPLSSGDWFHNSWPNQKFNPWAGPPVVPVAPADERIPGVDKPHQNLDHLGGHELVDGPVQQWHVAIFTNHLIFQ